VVSRDLAQLAGAAVLRTTHHTVPVAPTRIGKYATFSLAVTVVLALAGDFGAYPGGDLGPFVIAFALLAAECVALSFAQYFLFFVRAFRRPAP
jgi:cardiolipin synthase